MDGMPPEEVRAVLSTLSREFSRPLRAFREGLDAVSSRHDPGGPARDHATIMATVCDDLITVTDSYSDYLWQSRDDRPLALGRVRLADLAEEVDRRYAEGARMHSWTVLQDGPDAEVAVDRPLVLRLLDHLIDNAARYTPIPGTIAVGFAIDGESWRVDVRDDGPGIPEPDSERVLEPFVRLARDVNAAIPGAGLGLALCRNLANRMGGGLRIYTPAGGGTLVSVTFPLVSKADRGETEGPGRVPVED